MNQDQKNLYLAFALSILVFVGWNYFYGAPTMEKTRQTQIANQNPPTPVGTPAQPGAPVTPGAPVAPAPAVAVSRAEALAASPRVTIDTASLKGSIALKGGRMGMVTVHAPDGADARAFETTRNDQRHFWRRPKALGTYL